MLLTLYRFLPSRSLSLVLEETQGPPPRPMESPLAAVLTPAAAPAPAAQVWVLLALAVDGVGLEVVSKLCYEPCEADKRCKQLLFIDFE